MYRLGLGAYFYLHNGISWGTGDFWLLFVNNLYKFHANDLWNKLILKLYRAAIK